MAIDSAAKRKAALNFGRYTGVMPLVDGDIANAADRQAALGGYIGIAALSTSPGIPPIYVMSGPPVVWLEVFGPLPAKASIGRIDLNVRRESVTFGTAAGGFETLSVGDVRREQEGMGVRQSYHLDTDVLVPRWAHLELWVNGAHTAEFRASEIEMFAGRVELIQGIGYGAWATKAGTFADPAGGDLVNDGVLLRQVARETAPLITLASGPDWVSVTSERDPLEFAEMTLYDALEQVVAATGIRWAVWRDRVLYTMPATVTGEPTYQMAFTDGVRWRESWTELATDARLITTDASGVESVTPLRSGRLSSADLGGTTHTIPLRSSAGLQVAEQWAKQELIRRGEANVSASFTLDTYQPMSRYGGGAVDQWQVRYGETLQVGDQTPRFIERTSCDLWTGTLNGTLGTPSAGSNVGLLTRVIETAMTVRDGRDPLTGGRRRT